MTLSPGLGKGKVVLYHDILSQFDEFYDIDHQRIDKELERLDAALARISDDLENLASQVEREIDSALSGVFHAHLAILQDESLRSEMEKEIREELVSAGSAVQSVFRRWERRFRSMDAEVSQQKGDDLRDLARRLVSALAGVHAHALENLPRGSVLVANRLLPSDTIFLARNTAAAALLEIGGKASHAALFAREIGLPCIAGIENLMKRMPSDTMVLVDANQGQAIIDPSPENLRQFDRKVEIQDRKIMEAQSQAYKPAVTLKGKPIAVMANIGDVDDTRLAIENGADGVGLYRLEQTYLGSFQPPSTEKLITEIRTTLLPAKDRPVYVRLLDVGADKPLPFLEHPKESNPALGERGVRFLLRYPDLLFTQLEALLALANDFQLHILVPMITLPSDMQQVRQALKKTASKIRAAKTPPLGAMIETPAAALAASDIATHADFMSFGTNDLTQYAFAADRENAAVDDYFDDENGVLFKLMKMVHDNVPDLPLSVCGELASRSNATAQLLDCGISSLSVVPPAIPAVKAAIRKCDNL